uniref:Uncharacterized protein n=1 Tax=Caenorhabditis japonica TaxID=281687 RepID=A0A8R1I9A8_CAEJA
MEQPKRSKNDELLIDPSLRGSADSSFSFSARRSQFWNNDQFAASPNSSIGPSLSLHSSRNSEAEVGEFEDADGVRTVMSSIGISDMIYDTEIQLRYPQFYQFLINEHPTWFEPASVNGAVFKVRYTTPLPENHEKLRQDISYEMLDVVYRFYREKHVTAQLKREKKDLIELNEKLRAEAVQMFTKAEQEEEFISNSLLKKIQKLNQDKDDLVKKYQKDEESLTKSLITTVAKLPDVHAETEKLMADKQAEIERLRAYCQRAEKSYQEELKRLRAEKVNNESALEKEQELIINTIGKRMTKMNEEKRNLQLALEHAYLNGYVGYNETVDSALDTSAHKMITVTMPFIPEMTPTLAECNKTTLLYLENQKLNGLLKQEQLRSEDIDTKLETLTAKMAEMETFLTLTKDPSRSNEMLAFQWADHSAKNASSDQSPSNASVEKRGRIGIAQPYTSRPTTSTSTSHADPYNQPSTSRATFSNEQPCATVHPTQRAGPSTRSRNRLNRQAPN